MFEYLDKSAIEPIIETFTLLPETILQPVSETLNEVAVPAPATSHEGSTTSQRPLWQPTEPQFTKSIAEYYGVSRKSVQEWFQKVKEACPWVADADLKLPDERYTPIAASLMGNYRTSGLPFKAWKAQIWEQNAALVAALQSSQLAQAHENAANVQSEPATGMVPYQPQPGETERFTPPALKLRQFVSTAAFVSTAKQQTATALDITQSNTDALSAALINQMQQEGQKLGLTLFQAKYGTAHSVMAEMEDVLAKKSGLVDAAPPPLSA